MAFGTKRISSLHSFMLSNYLLSRFELWGHNQQCSVARIHDEITDFLKFIIQLERVRVCNFLTHGIAVSSIPGLDNTAVL